MCVWGGGGVGLPCTGMHATRTAHKHTPCSERRKREREREEVCVYVCVFVSTAGGLSVIGGEIWIEGNRNLKNLTGLEVRTHTHTHTHRHMRPMLYDLASIQAAVKPIHDFASCLCALSVLVLTPPVYTEPESYGLASQSD